MIMTKQIVILISGDEDYQTKDMLLRKIEVELNRKAITTEITKIRQDAEELSFNSLASHLESKTPNTNVRLVSGACAVNSSTGCLEWGISHVLQPAAFILAHKDYRDTGTAFSMLCSAVVDPKRVPSILALATHTNHKTRIGFMNIDLDAEELPSGLITKIESLLT